MPAGSVPAGPFGPRASACARAASRSSAFARAPLRNAAASAAHASRALPTKTPRIASAVPSTADHDAPACVTLTMASLRRRACTITSAVIAAPMTTVRPRKPRMLRA